MRLKVGDVYFSPYVEIEFGDNRYPSGFFLDEAARLQHGVEVVEEAPEQPVLPVEPPALDRDAELSLATIRLNEALRLRLRPTDWYYIRRMETDEEVPATVQTARLAARGWHSAQVLSLNDMTAEELSIYSPVYDPDKEV
jgi:hypothetical protein